jgi:hypothetical protein
MTCKLTGRKRKLEWALRVGFVVPWLEWAIHKFPHLVSGKVFHHYYKRPEYVPRQLLFKRNLERNECSVCYRWRKLHPEYGISFFGGEGCHVCETWLEVTGSKGNVSELKAELFCMNCNPG